MRSAAGAATKKIETRRAPVRAPDTAARRASGRPPAKRVGSPGVRTFGEGRARAPGDRATGAGGSRSGTGARRPSGDGRKPASAAHADRRPAHVRRQGSGPRRRLPRRRPLRRVEPIGPIEPVGWLGSRPVRAAPQQARRDFEGARSPERATHKRTSKSSDDRNPTRSSIEYPKPKYRSKGESEPAPAKAGTSLAAQGPREAREPKPSKERQPRKRSDRRAAGRFGPPRRPRSSRQIAGRDANRAVQRADSPRPTRTSAGHDRDAMRDLASAPRPYPDAAAVRELLGLVPLPGRAVPGRGEGAQGVRRPDRLGRAAPGADGLRPRAAQVGARRRAVGRARGCVAVGALVDRGPHRAAPARSRIAVAAPTRSRCSSGGAPT